MDPKPALRAGRPPSDASEVERWTGSEWIQDDGLIGQAFVGKDVHGYPIAWAVDAKDCYDTSSFINLAVRRCADRWYCANGKLLFDRPTMWGHLKVNYLDMVGEKG